MSFHRLSISSSVLCLLLRKQVLIPRQSSIRQFRKLWKIIYCAIPIVTPYYWHVCREFFNYLCDDLSLKVLHVCHRFRIKSSDYKTSSSATWQTDSIEIKCSSKFFAFDLVTSLQTFQSKCSETIFHVNAFLHEDLKIASNETIRYRNKNSTIKNGKNDSGTFNRYVLHNHMKIVIKTHRMYALRSLKKIKLYFRWFHSTQLQNIVLAADSMVQIWWQILWKSTANTNDIRNPQTFRNWDKD